MPGRAFLDEASVGMSDAVKQTSPQGGQAPSNPLRSESNENRREDLFRSCLSPCAGTWSSPALGLRFTPPGPCFSGLWTSINYWLSGVPHLLRADSGTLQLLKSQFPIINICVYPLSVLFLQRTQTNTRVKLLSEKIYWCLTLHVRSMFNVIIIAWRTSAIWIPKLILQQVILTYIKVWEAVLYSFERHTLGTYSLPYTVPKFFLNVFTLYNGPLSYPHYYIVSCLRRRTTSYVSLYHWDAWHREEAA